MLLLIAVAVIYFVMGQKKPAGRNSRSLRNFFLPGQPQSVAMESLES
jgi:hypothetical protein